MPHLVALEVFGQRGVVTGRIVQEPERGDERVRFAIELEQVVADSAIYHLGGQVLVTVKDVYLPADYGDRVSLRGKLQQPRPARNQAASIIEPFCPAGYLRHSLRRQTRTGRVPRIPARALAIRGRGAAPQTRRAPEH